MNFLVVGLITLVVVEVALRLPLAKLLKGFAGVYPRIARMARRKNVSDHWKEKLLLGLSARLMVYSLSFGGIVLLLLGIFGAGLYVAETWLPGIMDFSMTWAGILSATAIACIYAWGRSRG